VQLGWAFRLAEPIPGVAADADVAGEMAVEVAKTDGSNQTADIRDDRACPCQRLGPRPNGHHQEDRHAQERGIDALRLDGHPIPGSICRVWSIPPAPATEPRKAPRQIRRRARGSRQPSGDGVDWAGDGAHNKRGRRAATTSSDSTWSIAPPAECQRIGTACTAAIRYGAAGQGSCQGLGASKAETLPN